LERASVKGEVTVTGAENSEVLPTGSVAVAVTNWPVAAETATVMAKLTLPLPSVVANLKPRKV